MIPEVLLKEYGASLISEEPGEVKIRLKSGKVVTLSRVGDQVLYSPGVYTPEELEFLEKVKKYV